MSYNLKNNDLHYQLYNQMAYLILNDYKKLIQADNLSQIVGNDFSLLNQVESAALSEVTSYLVQKYDVAYEFKSIYVNTLDVGSKKFGERLYLDAVPFSDTKDYNLDEMFLINGKVYSAFQFTAKNKFVENDFDLIGNQFDIFSLGLPNGYTYWDYYATYTSGQYVFYKDKQYTSILPNAGVEPGTNTAVWSVGTTYTETNGVYAGGSVNGAWIKGDNRNQQMVNYLIDIILYHLHSRIAPRNIPELRVKRYDDAIYWLKQCAKGEFITGGLPLLQPMQGMRIRHGGSLQKQNNNY